MKETKPLWTGTIKFSVIQSSGYVAPHCGTTNQKLRAHLGLVVPGRFGDIQFLLPTNLSFPESEESSEGARMRVATETVRWREGEVIVFDDSFEHEVWNGSNETRIVLIIDFNHPDLSEEDRQIQDRRWKVIGHKEDGPRYSLQEEEEETAAEKVIFGREEAGDGVKEEL